MEEEREVLDFLNHLKTNKQIDSNFDTEIFSNHKEATVEEDISDPFLEYFQSSNKEDNNTISKDIVENDYQNPNRTTRGNYRDWKSYEGRLKIYNICLKFMEELKEKEKNPSYKITSLRVYQEKYDVPKSNLQRAFKQIKKGIPLIKPEP